MNFQLLLSCLLFSNVLFAQQWHCKPDYSVQYLTYFGIGSESVQKNSVIGYNAANYALMQRTHPDVVAQGIGVPVYFYQETLKSCGADKLIEKLLKDAKTIKIDQLDAQIEKIRTSILQAKVPKNLINQIKNAYAEFYKGKSLRIMASPNHYAVNTDINAYPANNYIEISTEKDLAQQIAKVYASYWQPYNFKKCFEDYYLSKSHASFAMGLLITEEFEAPYALGETWTAYYTNKKPSIEIIATKPGAVTREHLAFSNFESKWYQTKLKSSKFSVFVNQQDLTPIIRQIQSKMADLDPIYRALIPKTEFLQHNNFQVGVDYCILKIGKEYKLQFRAIRWHVVSDKK